MPFGLPFNIEIITKKNYEKEYKSFINNLYDNISLLKMKEHPNINYLIEKNTNEDYSKYIKHYNPKNHCDYLTDLQGRMILTEEWKEGIKNNEIKIRVFPCNYDSHKPECVDFVPHLDKLIKEFVDSLKKEILEEAAKKKYLKYKLKYINLKNKHS